MSQIKDKNKSRKLKVGHKVEKCCKQLKLFGLVDNMLARGGAQMCIKLFSCVCV